VAAFESASQRPTLADQLLVADHLVQGSWSHPGGQRLATCRRNEDRLLLAFVSGRPVADAACCHVAMLQAGSTGGVGLRAPGPESPAPSPTAPTLTDPRPGALPDRNQVKDVDQDVDDGQRRCQRPADPDYPPDVPHDVGILLGGSSCQQSLATGPARPLDFHSSSPFPRPNAAGLRHPLLGDDLGFDLCRSGLFLGR